MRYKLALASAFFGATLLIGCDKSESTSSTPASRPPDATETSAEKSTATATDSGTGTLNNMKDMAHDKTDAAASKLNAAADSVTSGANAPSATAPSNSAVSTETSQAQALLDQAMQYIKDNKLDDANNVLTKLEAMKSKLPAEWASKIDSARSAYNTAKSGSDKLKSLVPGGAK